MIAPYLDKCFRIEGRRVWYVTVEEMKEALDRYLVHYNTERAHQGRLVNGRMPFQAYKDGLPKP